MGNRVAIDVVTGEDVSDRPWMGQYALTQNPCP